MKKVSFDISRLQQGFDFLRWNFNFCGEGKFNVFKKTMINFYRLDLGITSRIKYSKIVINLSLVAWESIWISGILFKGESRHIPNIQSKIRISKPLTYLVFEKSIIVVSGKYPAIQILDMFIHARTENCARAALVWSGGTEGLVMAWWW